MASLDLKNSIGVRLLIIATLTLLFLIPTSMIEGIIEEREDRRDDAAEDITGKWGDMQAIVGPVLTIPYRHTYQNSDDEVMTATRYAHFLPEEVRVDGAVDPQVRYRSIYKAIVYNSTLRIRGSFEAPDPSLLNIAPSNVLLDQAFVSLGIRDMKGIKELIEIDWDGTTYSANPGIESSDVLSSGVSIAPALQVQDAPYTFDVRLNLNGSSGLFFSPVGKQTHVTLSSEWPNPSFAGGFLPTEREISASGFTSTWNVLHLNRNFPQQWKGRNPEVAETVFGVNLLLSVDEYQKSMRTAKYAILFISLTFLTFFMMELLAKKVIHPVHYLLIGFALLTFYTLLLSLSEYMVFAYAYLLASVGVVSLISVYSLSVLSDWTMSGLVLGVLSLLYGYLYILMQLQDYALLMGSIGLFVVLALVMYLTRNIDWFEIMGGAAAASTEPAAAPTTD